MIIVERNLIELLREAVCVGVIPEEHSLSNNHDDERCLQDIFKKG